MLIYEQLYRLKQQKLKSFGFLIDPDKTSINALKTLAPIINQFDNAWILFGGSHVVSQKSDEYLVYIREHYSKPCILFPGNSSQINNKANGILYLSLISGRNPEYLIGQHVTSALLLKESNLEIIPTGYILIDGGKTTSVQYISNTLPIPRDKVDLAISTAVAGELLGLKTIYLDAGSGAAKTISLKMIHSVKSNINIPLIIGGGINSIQKIEHIFNAGADMVVLGTILEENPNYIHEVLSFSKNMVCC